MIPSTDRLWMFLFWTGSLLIALATLRALVLPMDLVMPNMAHYLTDAPLALIAHLVGGPLALALAPFQLWAGLRQRRPALHRWTGRLYVLSVAVGGVGALALVPDFTGSAFAAAGFVALGVLWLAFTGLGIWHARAGDLAAHRRWMLRSVALTFGAVTLRLIMAPLMAAGWSVNDTYLITAWGCWVPNLIVIEYWLRRR